MISPMLCHKAPEPFSKDGWVWERKWDGHRALAYVDAGAVRLVSRQGNQMDVNGLGVMPKFLACSKAVLDGEIVTFSDQGKEVFGNAGRKVYVAFDVLMLEGADLTARGAGMPLTDRRRLLEAVVQPGGPVEVVESALGDGAAFYERMVDRGAEGVVAKRLSSKYVPGVRSHDWLKVRGEQEGVYMVVGYTRPEGSRVGLGAVMLAEQVDGRLVYRGKAGSGFDERSLALWAHELEKLKTPRCVVRDMEHEPKLAAYVEPAVLAKVTYFQVGARGHLRFPVVRRLMWDK